MESISLSATISAAAAGASTAAQFRFPSSSISLPMVHPRRTRKFCVLASTGGPSELDEWERLEFKFGRMIGEDPKLTMAKIMARKANPEMTPLEVEKLLEKKRNRKSKKDKVEEVPPDLEWERKVVSSIGGVDLVRPVTRKGVNFETSQKPVEVQDMKPTKPIGKVVKNSSSNVPNVILRKPTSYRDDSEDSSRFGFRPNLSLRMMKEQQKDRFSDMTLLKKPEPLSVDAESEVESSQSGDSQENVSDITLLKKPEPVSKAAESVDSETLSSYPVDSQTAVSDMSLSRKPKPLNFGAESVGKSSLPGYSKTDISNMTLSKKPESLSIGTDCENKSSHLDESETDACNMTLSKKSESLSTGTDSENKSSHLDESVTDASSSNSQNVQRRRKPPNPILTGEPTETKSGLSEPVPSIDAALLGRPKRLDLSLKAASENSKEQMMPEDIERSEKLIELEKNLPSSVKDLEARDWKKAEDMALSGEKEEVEIVGSSTRGFTVSFHSLIGILPYRNLTSKWKFLAFESWLRKNGIDPSKYRKSLGVISTSDTAGVIPSPDLLLEPKVDDKLDIEITPDMKLEDFLKIYDRQKLKFLSSFVGQKIRVIVASADRNSRRLIFSTKPKETEEMVENKRSLMSKLSVGDVVSCCIKKITYFGVFVEVEGVPALIHQTEVSWDATLDPASFFKVGQIVEAKVHQLDFSLERIFLSLKEITPDPLIEALDAVVGGHGSPDAQFKEAQADAEWAEVESLMKELQQVKAIQSVSKGRYFVSPGLAPTFQVYMASMFENQYKLLARSGNRAQEVIVETSLDKEEMRSIIQTCTNKVQ